MSINQNNNTATNGGVGLCSLLFITFLVLKLTHVIDWSWWWITAPLWAPVILVFVIFFIVVGIAALADNTYTIKR